MALFSDEERSDIARRGRELFEERDRTAREAYDRELDRMEREVRFGPQPGPRPMETYRDTARAIAQRGAESTRQAYNPPEPPAAPAPISERAPRMPMGILRAEAFDQGVPVQSLLRSMPPREARVPRDDYVAPMPDSRRRLEAPVRASREPDLVGRDLNPPVPSPRAAAGPDAGPPVPPPRRQLFRSPIEDLARDYGYGKPLIRRIDDDGLLGSPDDWEERRIDDDGLLFPQGDWKEVRVPADAVWAGGSPPWVFDESYGGPNPDYRVDEATGRVYRRTRGPSGRRPPLVADQTVRTVDAGRTPIDALMDVFGEDVGYLRSRPFTNTQEQAMVERQKGRIRNNFATERQRAIDEAGAYNRPIGPVLDEINQREGQALADVDQQFGAMEAGEMRSRRGESRQMLSFLEALQRARAAEAMGIESALDDEDLRRILTAFQLASGAVPANLPASISGNLLDYASRLGESARSRLRESNQGLGELAYRWAQNR